MHVAAYPYRVEDRRAQLSAIMPLRRRTAKRCRKSSRVRLIVGGRFRSAADIDAIRPVEFDPKRTFLLVAL